MAKVTVIGAGFVGATVAQYIAGEDLADVVLMDVIEGLPEGKALDLQEASPLLGHDRKITGTKDFAQTKDSQIVVITAGIARKPGMSRDDLLKTNAGIVRCVAKEAVKYSSQAIFIVVTNPLDVMAYLTRETTGLPANRVVGMAGVLDSARFQTFVAEEMKVCAEDIKCMVLGGHGDLMVPLPRFSSVNGIPLPELMPASKIDALVQRTRDGGAEIVALLKTGSAFYAPGVSATVMVESILKNKRRLLPCSVYAQGEYGIKDVYIGLPIILGENGVEKILELKLTDSESAALKKSAASIKENIEAMNKLIAAAALVLLMILMPCFLSLYSICPAMAIESSKTSSAGANSDFSLEPDASKHTKERKEVENFLSLIEKQWNEHKLDALMSHYVDDYINNDGLDKKAVTDLTKEFWQQYPDAQSASQTKEIRIEGNFATVTSRDTATGTTINEVPTITGKGELRSISEGQLYLRKFADGWKIIGDRIDFEKVKVSYGLAKQLDVDFVAPEQVRAGKRYAAKVEIKLPTGLAAVAEITSQNLQYPGVEQIFPNVPQTEIWKALDTNALERDNYVLERMLEANASNHNELLMTKIGITNSAKNSLVGFQFLTRRLNIVPATNDLPPSLAEKVEAKDDAKASEKSEKKTSEDNTKVKKEQ